jgi:cyclase
MGKYLLGTRNFMKRRFLFAILLPFFSVSYNYLFSQTVNTPSRIVVKLSDRVYVVRHQDAPDGNAQGNTSIIIGDHKVVVVDACYLPSAARGDIALIKKLTEKPVDYLINTHWHADHQQGNPEYAKAFPHVTIIAHEETAKNIIAFEAKDVERYRKNLDSLKGRIATGKDNNGKSISAAELSDMKALCAGQDSVERELVDYRPCYPDLRITGNLDLNIGNETAQILYLGPMHTNGDIMVYLPNEKYLITGDVLVYPIPYFFGGGHPYSGLKVLETISQMDVKTFIPGHGELLNDKIYLNQEIDLVKYVISQVETEVYKEGLLGIKVENVRKAIDLTSYKKEFAKGDADSERFFDLSIGKGLIEGCFKYISK